LVTNPAADSMLKPWGGVRCAKNTHPGAVQSRGSG
jgi:hypothetical protein